MGKAKSKKPTCFQRSMTKSVFLYGTPNGEKANLLYDLQKAYTDTVNMHLEKMCDNHDLAQYIVNNDKRSSAMRAYEKKHRPSSMNSTHGQSAFDEAVTLLHNRIINIKNSMYGITQNHFTSSRVLFAACLQNKSQVEMVSMMKQIAASYKIQAKVDYYTGIANDLDAMNETEFAEACNEVRVLYDVIAAGYKTPHVKKAHVRLVSTNYKFEESNGIEAPYVISISDPANRGNTIVVPLNTSKNGIRRLKQYGSCNSAEFTMREDGRIRVSIAFKKKIKEPKCATYNGVDIGIVDALHSERHGAIGSMSSTIMFYKNTVEPSFGELSNIRNKKRKVKRFIRKHKTLPDEVRTRLRKKIDRLETMLRRAKKAYRRNRHYYNMLDHEIKAAVDGYIDKLNGDKSIVTVLELFDVKEFYKSHKENGIYSMNARGQLTQKLMEQLNWHGFSFIEVESAYTSQACPVCFCIDPENRKRKTFLCTCCGHKDDADHNATINISMRVEDDEVLAVCEKYKYSRRDRHKSIKSIFEKRNAVWLEAQSA